MGRAPDCAVGGALLGRADVEEVATPVRDWMLRELRPQEGETVLELAAGVG